MLFALFSCVSAIPLSYFQSEKPRVWNPPQAALFEDSYKLEHPLVSFPVVPFWGFGFRFDGDIMISLSNDEPWGMIEVAFVESKEGEKVWFTLDSRLDGQQYIGLSEHPLSHEIAALFPLPSYQAHLEVFEKEDAYTVSYMRGDEPISFSIPIVDGFYPPPAQNGHAMNHSQHDMMAILNISSLSLRRVQWLSSGHHTQSILWQPISGLMRQTVVGLRRGTWIQTDTRIHKKEAKLRLEESKECIRADHAMYCFYQREEERQLQTISLSQPLHEDEIASVHFSPALPDLRFIPQKRHCSDVFWNIAHQEHLRGKVCVHPLQYGATMMVLMHASQPSWVNLRPVLTSLTLNHEREEVYADSMVLSNGSRHKYTPRVDISDVAELSIPKSFLWNGKDFVSHELRQKMKGRAYSVGVPLIPQEGMLLGTVDVKSSFAHPFLLGLRAHMLPTIQEFSFRVEVVGDINRITLSVKPSKKPKHGGWIEVDLGEIAPSRSAQSIFLQGGQGGVTISEPLFLDAFHVRTVECSFALNGILDSKPKDCMRKASMFWMDE